MNAVRPLLATLCAAALALSGCTASEPDIADPTVTTTGTTPSPVTHEAALDEQVTGDGWSFTVTEAVVSPDCEHTGARAPDGAAHLTFAGHISFAEEEAADDGMLLTAEPLTVVTSDDETVDLFDVSDCRPQNEDLPQWSEVTTPGTDTEFLSAFVVPDNAEFLEVVVAHETWRFPLTVNEGATEVDAAPENTAPVAVEPTLVECMFAGGSWTESGYMSDGSIQYHPDCAARQAEFFESNPYRCPQTDHRVPGPEHCLPLPEAPRQQQQQPQEPSPWVQGQIDWMNCLEAGNSEEYCREALN